MGEEVHVYRWRHGDYLLFLSISVSQDKSLTEWLLSKDCFSWNTLILPPVLLLTGASHFTLLGVSLPILKIGVIITFTSREVLGCN